MGIFGKNRSASVVSFIRDPRKANRFFDHAQVVADARNYDYAIECYLNGLRYDPDNISKHEALREVALKRKVAGGKPAGLTDRLKKWGRDPIEKLLHTEMLWSKDPLNITHMAEVMSDAADVDRAYEDVHLGELIHWVASMAIKANQSGKRPNKIIYLKARDLFAYLRAYDKAIEACKLAVQLDPQDTTLLQSLKDLEAEQTIKEGGYDQDFRSSVLNADKQRELEQDSAIVQTATGKDEQIARRRAAYEEDPQDLDKLQKLVAALLQKETDESEQDAIHLLEQALEQTGQYRLKVRIGDIKIKQFARKLRLIGQQLKENPDDTSARRQWKELKKKKLWFELEEFIERVQNYPTDLRLRYELGRRLFAYRKYDEAIAAFQQAKGDPRYRAASLHFLGQCYVAQGWFEEAIETLRTGIEAHSDASDRLAMELRYQLMQALKQSAEQTRSPNDAVEAQKVASQILQTDINYRDIRQQIEKIRSLVEQLRQEQSQLSNSE